MSWGAFYTLVCPALLACGGAPSSTEPVSHSVAEKAPLARTDAAAAAPDRAADCELVTGALEIGPSTKGRGVNAASIVPETPAERDAKLAAIDGYLARWKAISSRVASTDVRDAASAYVVALKKQRDVIAALRYEIPPPHPPPSPPKKPHKKMTNAEIARQAALREAAEFGMEGLLGPLADGPFLREEDRRTFGEARGDYLDAWEPLLRMCEDGG